MKNTVLAAAGTVTLALGCLATPAPAEAQSTPYVSQMMLTGANFCPRGYLEANGQLLAISANTALFSLIGTIYGGDGRTTFALPDLRGRAPIHVGQGPGLANHPQGERGGTADFTVTLATMPSHTHTGTIAADPAVADTAQPAANSFARSVGNQVYLDGDPALNNMHRDTLRLQNTGGNQPVSKRSPYQVMRWCVAQFGVFPSRS